ncbi:glycosyltransferase family 2 protein [Sandaracinobacter neustonicus]|uniref:Glycosyltransferase family 2 protein n=1 Tax=Sandaracinobacter neustonicus TaxID=1715348 RepID=A0A501XTH0_9SPHN|nr:glycosyltransferase family A protein [Sandaracinobacter neustonicus]TPE63653.1 glycosyltransferase family 2 protein [Sandaracinobacter neustonicus]
MPSKIRENTKMIKGNPAPDADIQWEPAGEFTPGLVSVIMPNLNGAAFLAEAIESVTAQSYSNFELLIADDGSTDKSLPIIAAAMKQDSRIRLLSAPQARQGAAQARNRAIAAAVGEYIAFLDSDDIWCPSKLDQQISLLNEKKIHCCHGSYKTMDTNGVPFNLVNATKHVTLSNMKSYNHIGNLTGIYRCAAIGKFFQKSIGHEDYEMWIRILHHTDSIAVLSPIAHYRMHGHNVSGNKLRSALWTFQVHRNAFGLTSACSSFIPYALQALSKRK